ncbi:MAG: ATP synthase F1 subunit gamma [Deltaproteobacteria bacterium]|nr:ATP synthase F1 subunit gamma [Deltaproteobacteria bacterium]
MATLKDILNKISAVKKTQQITRAMNMVAAAKLRGTQDRMERFNPYARKFAEVLENLSSRVDPDIHPLLVKRENVSRVELLLLTSDRGLCGSFNMNNIYLAENWIRDQKKREMDYSLTIVGKKGRDYYRKRDCRINASHVQIYGKVDISFINHMAMDFISRYINNEMDELYMIYTSFEGVSKQAPTLVKLIPIEPPKTQDNDVENPKEYLFEPGAGELLIELLPKHIGVQILNAFLQNEVSEHAARMAAMDNATRNCKEMVGDLTLIYNKARQASITSELMDIVSGAEAIKGA